MKNLSIKATNSTPMVVCNYEKGWIVLKGKSLPSDTHEFYDPIIKWIDAYIQHPKPKTIVDIHFVYFNTSSSKYILECFKRFVIIKNANFDLEINWYYEADEEDMLEAGQDYETIIKTPFNFIEVSA